MFPIFFFFIIIIIIIIIIIVINSNNNIVIISSNTSNTISFIIRVLVRVRFNLGSGVFLFPVFHLIDRMSCRSGCLFVDSFH